MDEKTNEVGSNLVRLRRLTGMSLNALAHASGVCRATIHNIERGRGNPRLQTLALLARALCVSPVEFWTPVEELDERDRRARQPHCRTYALSDGPPHDQEEITH